MQSFPNRRKWNSQINLDNFSKPQARITHPRSSSAPTQTFTDIDSDFHLDAPEKIWFTHRIKVTDRAGHLINTTSSFDGKRVTIAFTQPVLPRTTLKIDLEGVRTSDLLGRTWLFASTGVHLSQVI